MTSRYFAEQIRQQALQLLNGVSPDKRVEALEDAIDSLEMELEILESPDTTE